MELEHDATMKVIDEFRAEMRSEFAALRAGGPDARVVRAVGWRAANQVEVMRQVSPRGERIAVVERR